MDPIAPVAGRFISAVRRRILLVRIAESVAMSMAAASGIGLAVVPILWWRGESALPTAAALLGAGCVLGAIRGFALRPSRLEAAIEADAQLGLQDLLGTILSIEAGKSGSAWQMAVAAMAEERCRSLRPSELIVNRLGIRGWARVGILAGLLLSFSLLTARPSHVTAAGSARQDVPQDSSPAVESRDEELSMPAERPPGPGGTDSNSGRGVERDQVEDSAGETSAGKDSPGRASSGLISGAGGGVARTSNRTAAELAKTQNAVGDGSGVRTAGNGTGEADPHIGLSGKNDSVLASPGGGNHAGIWNGDGSDADAEAAGDAIDAGKMPEGDQDLVRDYFGRD